MSSLPHVTTLILCVKFYPSNIKLNIENKKDNITEKKKNKQTLITPSSYSPEKLELNSPTLNNDNSQTLTPK